MWEWQKDTGMKLERHGLEQAIRYEYGIKPLGLFVVYLDSDFFGLRLNV